MRLQVLVPTHVEVDEDVDKIIAEAVNGSFCLLPRHVDFVAALAPSLLCYEANGRETFLAVDGGLLVKCGKRVMVSSPVAIRGPRLEELERAVEESFKQRSEREERAKHALNRMEADVLRRFSELERYGRG